MAGVTQTRDKINNFTLTLLLRRNRQYIDNGIHPTTAEIRMESRMLTLTLQTIIRPAVRDNRRCLDNESIAAHVERRGYTCFARTQRPGP
ncbi:hypothetical protein Pint_19666 [Pistacia integerrima]|uniref:Uncharacterized protein n=1 Tax=Pistacia integerrima TaxID=434235 RepID=A0ACC0XFB2_9ROSI|nr:hypothetical protein Pint_19666 [Pistacia integerrima]